MRDTQRRLRPHSLQNARQLLGEFRGWNRQIASAQLAKHEIGARDVTIVDLTHDQIVALHGANLDLVYVPEPSIMGAMLLSAPLLRRRRMCRA